MKMKQESIAAIVQVLELGARHFLFPIARESKALGTAICENLEFSTEADPIGFCTRLIPVGLRSC